MSDQPNGREMVIVSAFEDTYHRSKSGFYSKCGSDFNPHHAATIERSKAEKLEYKSCSECGFGEYP